MSFFNVRLSLFNFLLKIAEIHDSKHDNFGKKPLMEEVEALWIDFEEWFAGKRCWMDSSI
jgi:hypothetical protein